MKKLSFPLLRRLNLQGDTSDYPQVVSFLLQHPEIEELSIPELKKLGKLPILFLPNLKRLCCTACVLVEFEMAYSRVDSAILADSTQDPNPRLLGPSRRRCKT